jgi:hypothetical protein
MGGTSKEFRLTRDEIRIEGTIRVDGSPNDRRTAEALEAAVYERVAELEREGELKLDAE